jgi:hypothetical protein
VEKWGKTTLASQAPAPFILMARDNGYDTLVNAGTVKAHAALDVPNWPSVLSAVDQLIEQKHDRQTLVLDGLTGLERMCHEHVCETCFKGDWGEHGFAAYAKGFDLSVTEWLKLLQRLDVLLAKGIGIIMLGHARTKSVKNPMGADYDRFEPECHAKTWACTLKWADAILFGKFHAIVDMGRREASKKLAEQKGKAIGGTQRVIFTSPHDAFVAGNRYEMDSEIWLDERDSMYETVMAQINKEQQ